jgi:general secretion pathway protein D
LYDIRDLTHAVPNYPGPELEVPEPGGSVVQILPPVAPEVEPSAQDFVDIIQRVVAPNTWADPGVSPPSEYNGSLIVTNSADVHKQIDELLRSLRNQRGKQIHIRSKFLNIENSAMEEIGVNWNNFSGNPRAGSGQPGSLPLPGQGTSGGIPPDPGTPANIGGYFGDAGYQILTAGQVNNQLLAYSTDKTLPVRNGSSGDGLAFQTQTWQVNTNLYLSAVLTAVEKERRGNIMFESACTIFNGQNAHIVHMNQQAYIGDYDVVQGQYDPVISVLSYGTVLDVQGIASADNKYITMTVKPTHTRVNQWRRFGPAVTSAGFGAGGGGVQDPAGRSIAGTAPLLVPELIYQTVRTSVTIPDGGSLLLSSMTDGQSLRSHAGIPFISHIPFLGRLFSANGRNETERTTIIIVQGDIVLFDEIEAGL